MTHYFYFDQTNTKRGPVSEDQLRQLAAQGIIGLHTPMETDTGHKGVAGQIPGLFPNASQQTQAPPVNLFCTNCGNSVSAQAVGCMSCGVKPTGHKKFCRQCGAGIGSHEQVICTKCGASLASTFIPGAKQLAESVVSSSSLAITKKAFIGVIAIAVVGGLVWFVSGFFGGGGDDWRTALRNAQPGDFARYEVTIQSGLDTETGNFAFEVLANDGRIVRLRQTTRSPFEQRARIGGRTQTNEVEIDLSKPEEALWRLMLSQEDMPGDVRNARIDIERGRVTRETLSVAGQSFNCVVTESTIIMTTGNITVRVPIVEWTSRDAPITGSVKSEMRITDPDGGTIIITTTLAEFRKARR